MEKHHRRSIRLLDYDYSLPNLYFVTICVNGMHNLLGDVVEFDTGECAMELNDAGQMVDKWYYKLEDKFTDVICDEMIIMPNHIHFIINKTFVGADPCVCPNDGGDTNVGADPCVCPNDGGDTKQGEHMGSPLRRIVQWFKTMTTNEYIRNVKQNGWQPFENKFWQRNYYEHIIRNEKSYEKISDYIRNNPAKWQEDRYYRNL